jgi:ubiquinone/menaquinone biosynthesis C-methylase UbiE
MTDNMVEYYKKRAKEYEEIYEWRDPNRQNEQDKLAKAVKDTFKGKMVLDIGCGTGYWTKIYSYVAESIVGIDINQSVLEIAKSKEYGCPVKFRIMDAFKLDFPENMFTGALASFWLSHVEIEKIDEWIDQMHKVMKPGAVIFIADNTYIEGIGGRLVTKEGDPNTYKMRTLNDGSHHLIIKNYFSTEKLVEIFSKHTKGISEKNVFHGNCFWWIKYHLIK